MANNINYLVVNAPNIPQNDPSILIEPVDALTLAEICDALELFRMKASETLFVGDLASDILYCRDVPIDIACVGYGYHPSSYLKKFSPIYLLETIENFVKFLLSI